MLPAASLAVTVTLKPDPATAEDGMAVSTRELAGPGVTLMFEFLVTATPETVAPKVTAPLVVPVNVPV